MLCITSSNKSILWQVGEDKDNVFVDDTDDKMLMVSADEGELDYIRARFSNIPMVCDTIVYWRGEIAHFILDNL